jgi:hypothetical protein
VDILGYTERIPTDRFSELAETAADQFGLVTVADAEGVGYRPKTLSKLAGRGQLERVSRGIYRVPFLPGGEMQAYMAAALWPVGVQGVFYFEDYRYSADLDFSLHAWHAFGGCFSRASDGGVDLQR